MYPFSMMKPEMQEIEATNKEDIKEGWDEHQKNCIYHIEPIT